MDVIDEILASKYAQKYEQRKDRLRRLLDALRRDSRKPLKELAQELGTFTSTISDDLRAIEPYLWFTVIPLRDISKPFYVQVGIVEEEVHHEPLALHEFEEPAQSAGIVER